MSSEPYKTLSKSESNEISKAESKAASAYKAWQHAKSPDSGVDKDEAQRLMEVAEENQDELKRLQQAAVPC